MASKDIEVIITVKLERSEHMTMHDERWTLGVAENGDVRLRDQKTGLARRFGGPRALFDALGVLADWRQSDQDESFWSNMKSRLGGVDGDGK